MRWNMLVEEDLAGKATAYLFSNVLSGNMTKTRSENISQ